jgi:hypothetical protein
MEALDRVLRLPAVGSKRFLTSKVDRCVTGLVAQQQCVGPLQVAPPSGPRKLHCSPLEPLQKRCSYPRPLLWSLCGPLLVSIVAVAPTQSCTRPETQCGLL